MTDSDEVTTRHPEDVRVVRETIRHLFPLLDDGGDAADGWSDAYAVVAALDRLSAAPVDDREREGVLLADPAPVGLTQAGYTDEAIGPNEARMIAMNERLVKERDELRAEVDRLSAAPVGPTEVAQDQVDWRVMALRVKHENAGPECFCENPKPGAHAQSCPRFGMNP